MSCAYCGTPLSVLSPPRRPTRDHAWPRSRFLQYLPGPGTEPPVLACCRSCNADKSDLTLSEWLASLPLADPRWTRIARVAALFPLPPPARGTGAGEFSDRWSRVNHRYR